MKSLNFVIVFLIIISCSKTSIPSPKSANNADKPAWTLTAFAPIYPTMYVDGGASVAKDANSVYYLGYEPGEAYGKYKTPAYEFNWLVYKGKSIDNLALWKKWRPKLNGQWPMPAGDEAFWPSGLWIDTNGDWYTTVHIEFNYNNGVDIAQTKNWFRRIGAAKSTDQGSSWTYLGDIITSDNPTDSASSFLGNYVDLGPGDQHLFVDNDYFYVTYDNNWIRKTGSSVSPASVVSGRIARCAIKDKMGVGKWTKWYKGSWSQPGLKGYDTDITFAGHHFESLFYNTYLKKYIGIGKYNGFVTLSTADNLENISFSEPMKLDTYTSDVWGFYNDPWDINSGSKNITGQNFRIYAGIGPSWGIKYATVTLNSGGMTDKIPFKQNYPAESVPDRNSGYER